MAKNSDYSFRFAIRMHVVIADAFAIPLLHRGSWYPGSLSAGFRKQFPINIEINWSTSCTYRSVYIIQCRIEADRCVCQAQ